MEAEALVQIRTGSETDKEQTPPPDTEAVPETSFLWADLTRRCNLECAHCYNESGPSGTHGTMEEQDWLQVIGDAANADIKAVQFIGGEPMLHPSLPALIEAADEKGLSTQVYSNLTHVRPEIWDVIERTGTSIATSWYSGDAETHERITNGRNSQAKTFRNIQEIVRRRIPLSVGIIVVEEGQDMEAAQQPLLNVGVSLSAIHVDRMRQIGRGERDEQIDRVSELCGACIKGVVAVGPTGDVTPCIMSSDWIAGNVHDEPLDTILSGGLVETRNSLAGEFATREHTDAQSRPCDPGMCNPLTNPCVPNFECRPTS